MLKIALIIVIILIVAVVLFAASRPSTFKVERSILIKAPAQNIFSLVNDFHLWDGWTPYNKDPAMQKTYSGSASGKGAVYAWEGNKEVGKGEIKITDATVPSSVEMELHMIKPFEGRNKVVFSFTTEGELTRVSWDMDGQQNLMVKIMGLFISMDNMIGRDFEIGLAKLKALTEK